MSIATERAALFAQGLEIITRETWGARQTYTSSRPVKRAEWLFLHIAVVDDPNDLVGTEREVMRNIEAIGEARFGIGCSYNAAAFDTGRLYEAQPLERRGAHTVNDLPNPSFPEGSLNHLARALVLPQHVEDEVTDAQIVTAARWGAAVIRAGFAVRGAEWFGHRDVTRKSCPGPKAYGRLAELNRLTRHYEAKGLEEDQPFMALTDAEQDELLAKVREIDSYVGTKGKQQPNGDIKRDGVWGTPTYWRVADIATAIPAIVAELAALRSAVDQLGAGGTIDYARVEQAAADAVRDVLGGLDEP